MIIWNLKIFSQNVRKNSIVTNTILETLYNFDIILIQELPWSEIHKIPSTTNCDSDPLLGTCHHPNWIAFARYSSSNNDFPRVISYVNIRLSSLRFLLRRDLFDHCDISIISFINNDTCHYILNIYSDSSHSALKYLKDTEVNISNVLVMTSDFNIRDSLWDPSFPFHSSISNDLFMIADSFDLELSSPTNPGPTRFSDTEGESNSVIDLMFLRSGSKKLDSHSILSESRLSSDHAPLSIDIPISGEVILSSKLVIYPGSDQEKAFIKDIISNFTHLDTSNIVNIKELDNIVNRLGSTIEQMWSKNAKRTRISKHSKQWWSESCNQALNDYRSTRSWENWKSFKSATKVAKRSFFDNKIQEITDKSQGPWELMNWVKKRKLPVTEAIKYNGIPYLSPNSLWNALHNSFNTALHCQVNISILDDIDRKPQQVWNLFSKFEFLSAIHKCIDSSALGPDKMSW